MMDKGNLLFFGDFFPGSNKEQPKCGLFGSDSVHLGHLGFLFLFVCFILGLGRNAIN